MNKMEEWLLKEARVENPDTELQDLYTSKMMFGGRWVMDLIEKYAQQQVNDAKTEKEKCTLHSVSESLQADIRNKLTPISNLIAMISDRADIEYITKEASKSERSIEYLSNISKYSR